MPFMLRIQFTKQKENIIMKITNKRSAFMILAEKRVPFGPICVPEKDFENNNSQVWFIATQLRYYLARISVAPFEIKVADGDYSGIYLDMDENYTDDEFSINAKNGNIYIKGGKRGIIYGGYELLEIIGCRFFTPTCEKIPTLTKLEIGDINKHEKPVFEFRDTDYASIKNYSKFATQCRINGRWNDIPDFLGGSIKYALGAHSFARLVPHHEYRDTHPEYFSFYNGRRQSIKDDHWQLCLTNPDIVDIIVENARKILKENPDRKILSISQNDNPYSCQCENCLAQDPPEERKKGIVSTRLTDFKFPSLVKYILSFLGIAPMNDPKIACYMAVVNAKNTIQYGGVVVAPMVKEALISSFSILNIKPTTGGIPLDARFWIDKKTYIVDNFIGTEVKKLPSTTKYSFTILGNGNQIIAQMPEAGYPIVEGGSIILYTK